MRSSWEALAPGIEQELSTAVACRPPWEQRPLLLCVCVFVCSRLHGMAHVHVSHVRALCRVAVVVRVVLIEICVTHGFLYEGSASGKNDVVVEGMHGWRSLTSYCRVGDAGEKRFIASCPRSVVARDDRRDSRDSD